MKKLSKIIAALSSAAMSFSMLGAFSAGAEETAEKLYTFQEILDMSDEEYFQTFPQAESSYENAKEYYCVNYKKSLEQKAESEYNFYEGCTVIGADNPTDIYTLEEYIEKYLSENYKMYFAGSCSVTDPECEEFEVKYIPNVTEKNLEYIFGGYTYCINSPIENFETNDDGMYFDYQLSIRFDDLEQEKYEVNDENIMFKSKFNTCIEQVVPYLTYSAAPVSSSTKKAAVTGDVNLDEAVDLYDAVWIASHLVHIFDLSEGQQKVGDVNGDEACNLYDAVKIAKTLMP